jgi:hypothetical protein
LKIVDMIEPPWPNPYSAIRSTVRTAIGSTLNGTMDRLSAHGRSSEVQPQNQL